MNYRLQLGGRCRGASCYTGIVMYRARSKRAQRWRLILTYTLAPLFIITVVGLLIFYMLGYRFSLADHTVSQGGLLQFASRPSGAKVTIDTYDLPSLTATRYDTPAGRHTITMRRDGYIPWQKTVTVEPGKVLWLNYARLVPEKITQESLASYKGLASSLASMNGQLIVALPDASTPSLELVSLGQTVRRSTVAMPTNLFRSDAANSRFSLAALSKSGRYILVKHTFTKGEEWLLIDGRSPEKSRNITTIVGHQTDAPFFATSSEQKLYVLVDRELRLVDTEAQTMSAPIISNIAEVSQSAQGVIAYTTITSGTPSQRVAGYYIPGASTPHIVRTFYDDGKATLRLRIGAFSNDTYLALQYGSTIEINQARSLVANTSDELQLVAVATLAVPNGADSLEFSPTGRFILTQRAATYLTYDLELNALATTSLKGEATGTYPLGWLDSYIVWSDRDSMLRLYEFDGANANAIGAVVPGQAVVLSSDDKYIYAFQQASGSTTTELVRFRMLID